MSPEQRVKAKAAVVNAEEWKADGVQHYQELIGILCWTVEIG